MDSEIKLLQEESDFYARVAGEALATLRKMYGDTLDQKDVARVCEYLTGFATEKLQKRNPT